MPSRPNVARTKTIRKRERRELPAMYRNHRAGTWREAATPSERSITLGGPVWLDANGRWGSHRNDGVWGRGGGVARAFQGHASPKRDRGQPSLGEAEHRDSRVRNRDRRGGCAGTGPWPVPRGGAPSPDDLFY